MRTIVAVLALAIAALVGCSTMMKQPVPSAAPVASIAPVATVQAIKSEPVRALPQASRPAKEPSAYSSLQPFKKFKKGEGEGVAIEYKSRTKAQFIALLRDKKLAKQEMRVSCETLVRQMAEVHNLPFEGCEGAAAAIASDDYQVVACKDEMFQRDNWLTVTNPKATEWGAWHRKCLPGERVLAYKGISLISVLCLNVAIPVTQAPSPAPAPASVTPGPIRSCPEWWVLEVANWDNKAFYLPGIERTHAQEKFGVKFVGTKHVSREHGAEFRAAYAKGLIVHSETSRKFRVSLIMTSEAFNGDTTITKEQFYWDIVVVGSREVAFPIADIKKWDAIRVIAADGEEVLSPPLFAETGFHEMRFFNKMPGTSHGEWDNPLQKPCYKTEHWIQQPIGQPQVVQKQ